MLDLGGSIIASKRFEDQDPLTYDPYKDNYYFYHYDTRGRTTDGTLIKGYTYDEFGSLAQNGADSFLNEVVYGKCKRPTFRPNHAKALNSCK